MTGSAGKLLAPDGKAAKAVAAGGKTEYSLTYIYYLRNKYGTTIPVQ